MQAAERGQRGIVERLHAQRDAIDAGRAVAAKPRRLDRGGIGLERHLDVGRQFPVARDRIENGADGRGLHQRGGAAAEKNAHRLSVGNARGGRRNFRRKRAHEARFVDRGVAHVAVEVAIGTLRQAKRPMHVDAETGIGAGRLARASRQRFSERQGTPPRA